MRNPVLGLALLLAAGAAHAQQPLYFGVQSFDTSPTELAFQLEGLTSVMGRALKQPVRLEGVRKVGDYMKRIGERRYTVIYAPPSMVLDAGRSGGYEPIVKIPGRLAPAYFARTESGIAFLEDMKGKRLGTTDADSMMTRLGLLHLARQGVDPQKFFSRIVHFADVNAVLFAIKNGMVDVGLVNSTLYTVWTNQGNDLNLIEQAPGVAHLTIAVRGDLAPDQKRALAQALLEAHRDPEGRTYFQATGFPNFEPARNADYDDLRRLLAQK